MLQLHELLHHNQGPDLQLLGLLLPLARCCRTTKDHAAAPGLLLLLPGLLLLLALQLLVLVHPAAGPCCPTAKDGCCLLCLLAGPCALLLLLAGSTTPRAAAWEEGRVRVLEIWIVRAAPSTGTCGGSEPTW